MFMRLGGVLTYVKISRVKLGVFCAQKEQYCISFFCQEHILKNKSLRAIMSRFDMNVKERWKTEYKGIMKYNYIFFKLLFLNMSRVYLLIVTK